MKSPLISVIIPAHNEEENIVKVLKSLKEQTYSNIETIVVANGCEDNIYKLARPLADKVINLSKGNLTHAKNYGFNKSRGEFLVFLDADLEIKKDLIKKSLATINKGFVATISPIKTYGGDKIGDRLFTFIDNHVLIHGLVTIPRGFCMIQRKTFSEMDRKGEMFREDLFLGEDLYFGDALKKYGKIGAVNSMNKTFARRYLNQGYINTLWQYAKIYFNFLFRTNLKTYYSSKDHKPKPF